MIKRTVEISSPDVALRLKNRQLVVEKQGVRVGSIPVEDIGVLIIDSPNTVYTHSTLVEMSQASAVCVLCNSSHEPVAMVLPVAANSLVSRRKRAQADFPMPARKRLWRAFVANKIKWQALNMDNPVKRQALQVLCGKVLLDDKTNVEARAARLYWKNVFESIPDFKRDRYGAMPNGLLNYGYMVLRSALARALCGAGLCVSLGIHHSNKYNSFCLADDVVENFRPLVDRKVKQLLAQGVDCIGQESKKSLLELLTHSVQSGEYTSPLLIAMERFAANLVKCFENPGYEMEFPELWKSADTKQCG